MSTPVLELKEIRKEFTSAGETLCILERIDLVIAPGDTVAVTGPSGSGKSTLLGIMAGLERPTQGQIFFQGEAIHDWNEDHLASWRRQSVGFIFQNFRLIKTLTAWENVALPLEIQGYRADEAHKQSLALLGEMGIDKRSDHFPHQLSGGEQQRVAIARAYVHQPLIIFADEPTGSLDPATADKVLQSLIAINRQTKTTLVVVTHNRSTAEQLDRDYKLQGGTVIS